MCTKTPPEYQANLEHPPNKKNIPNSLLLAPSSFSFGTPIVLYKVRGSNRKNKPQNTLFVPYCHYRHKI